MINLMIKERDLVFLYRDERRSFLIKIQADKLHTDLGYLELKEAIGKEFGQTIKTNLGHSFYLLKPTLYEMIMKIKRQTQILYPKDIGMILLHSHIFPGARVIECGTGSGSLTTVLAYFVRPNGKVYSYERNGQFLKNAQRNIQRYGLSEWVEFKLLEVSNKFSEGEVDFVMIDIGSPWELIEASYKALKNGGRFATICPTFDQLTRAVFTLEEKGFTNIESIEVLVRRILVRRGKTRPEQKIPSHTGWLVFASKVSS